MSAFERIPGELRERPWWIVWRWGDVDPKTGKPKKPPFPAHTPEGPRHASNKKAEDWTTFEQAVAVVEAGRADGIGFAMAAPYVFVDLDEELSEPDQYAIALAINSYTEESVSGTGLHVIAKAELNGGRHPEGIGVFQEGRFCYCSGAHVIGTPTTIEERQLEIDFVLERYMSKPAEEPVPRVAQVSDLDDQELLEIGRTLLGDKFQTLWEGSWQSRYATQSHADLALCSYLAWLTGRDGRRIEHLFRSSGLYREKKWDRRDAEGKLDYQERTIKKAIAGTNDVYEPLSRNVVPTSNLSEPSLLETREVPTDITGKQCDLGEILAAFGELLVMPDPGAVEIALAAIVANYAPGDPVWPLLVGPPGCGKSEIVSSLRNAPAVWPLSSLTPQTLLSGYERKSKDKGPPASMLLQIGSFGILAFKDLTTVLSMHREARAQIISQLREVADGRTEKSFGNGLRVEWEGKLGLVAGVTPIIDEQHAFLAVMGERFVLYRMPEVSRPEIARRSLARRGRENELRVRIAALIAEFLAAHRNVGYLELPERFTEPLITLADIVTRSRSAVARDYQTRDILYLPEPEAPTRFAKQIAQLMAAAIKIGIPEERAWWLARKVGWDSVPAVRSAVIHLLARQEGFSLTYAELEERTGLPSTTVRRVVEDLVVLGLADHRKENEASNARWLITESKLARDYWDSGDEV